MEQDIDPAPLFCAYPKKESRLRGLLSFFIIE
jgi:hypothetical protein